MKSDDSGFFTFCCLKLVTDWVFSLCYLLVRGCHHCLYCFKIVNDCFSFAAVWNLIRLWFFFFDFCCLKLVTDWVFSLYYLLVRGCHHCLYCFQLVNGFSFAAVWNLITFCLKLVSVWFFSVLLAIERWLSLPVLLSSREETVVLFCVLFEIWQDSSFFSICAAWKWVTDWFFSLSYLLSLLHSTG